MRRPRFSQNKKLRAWDLNHRQFQSLLLRALDRFGVARIGVAHDAGARIIPQDAGDAGVGFLRSVADDHEAGVLRVPHPNAATVMEAYPGRAAGGVEQRIEQGPVADGIGTVAHGFGFAVG